MKKNELKNGMYVKLKDGTIEVIIGDKFMASDGSFNDLSYYDDDLINEYNHKWDIVEVFISSSPILFNESGFQRLWARPNPNIRIGDMFYKQANNCYIVILRIDDDTITYPYVGLEFRKGDKDSFDFEPYSFEELDDYAYVKHIDGIDIINEKMQGLVDGTI